MRGHTYAQVLGLLAVLAMAVLSANAAPASAAVSHVFDPALSLAGGTATSTTDPVGDPGATHPQKTFNDPCGVATDSYGDIYVANGASSSAHEEGGETRFDGRIDVFNAAGEFLTEILDAHWPCSLAVDAGGRLFVHEFWTGNVVRYDPTVYAPEDDEIAYGPNPVAVGSGAAGLGADPSNDHLFLVKHPQTLEIEELKADGSKEQSFGEPAIWDGSDLAALGQSKDLFVTGAPGLLQHEPNEGRVFVLDRESHEIKSTLDGSSTPSGRFSFDFGAASVAVDQVSGHFYVGDIFGNHVIDEFAPPEGTPPGEEAPEEYVGQFGLPANGLKNSEPYSDIAVDEGEHSPNQGYVYVTSGFQASNSHLYAFAPLVLESPEVRGEVATEVGEDEALLKAELNPHGVVTSYRFEYGLADCALSSCQSVPVPAGQTGEGSAFQVVSARAVGLSPGSRYHFRLVATSNCNPSAPAEECTAEGADKTFTTFPAGPPQACPNSALRVGPSARLPDCRAYELVSPANTNGRVPTASLFGEGAITSPPVLLGSADGESVLFGTEGGALPGLGGGGFHDAYVSTRGSDGWHTEFRGLSGAQAQKPFAAGASPDHGYSLWDVGGTKGTLANEPGAPANATMNYLRGPSGSIEPVGVGSLGSDPRAKGRWVTAGAAHVVFTAKDVRLEADAPPSGTDAIYDRRPGGSTRVISLLPNDLPQAAGEDAEYLGTAAQGGAVAFRIGNALYERAGEETVKVADEPVSFAGLSADGGHAFYLREGNIFAFEVATGTTTAIGSGGGSTIVNISADGSHLYFVSGLVLTGKANAAGAKPVPGGQNLYAWSGSSEGVRFVATVEKIDVVGEPPPIGGTEALIGGLGLWLSNTATPDQDQFRGPANDPSRTSPDGETLVFESRAKLTEYENGGHSEIYRYDDASGGLICVSCNPSEVAATSEARLESRYAPLLHSVPPVNAISLIENMAGGSNRVFFESGDALSFEDTDETSDVYEWEANGVGGCESSQGCVELISLGRSAAPNHLYGVGANGRDVFFWSSDSLVGGDAGEGPSIYDAREGGGFAAPPAATACQDEGCQGPLALPPALADPANATDPNKPSHRGHKKKHHRRHHSSRHSRHRHHKKGSGRR